MSPATTATFAASLLVTAIVGWLAGWQAADSEVSNKGHGNSTPSAFLSASPSLSPPPSPTPSPARSVTASPSLRTDAFDMPNLVGEKFREARHEALRHNLGVEVRFGEVRGEEGTVRRTDPTAGELVWPGLTIFLYVAGDPPTFAVPDVKGKPCQDGITELLDAGLKIDSYPSGKKGTVQMTDPPAGTKAAWNDQVKLFCAET